MTNGQAKPTTLTLAGTVRWQHRGRVEGGLLSAAKEGDPAADKHATIDDDGDYLIAGLGEGTWQLACFHSDARPASRRIEIKSGDDTALSVTEYRGDEKSEVPVRTEAQGALHCKLDFELASLTRSISRYGGWFVVVLLVLYVGGAVVYAVSHVNNPIDPGTPYANSLAGLEARARTASADQDPGRAVAKVGEEMETVLEAIPQETRDSVQPTFERLELHAGEVVALAEELREQGAVLRDASTTQAEKDAAREEKALKLKELDTVLGKLAETNRTLGAGERSLAVANPASFFWSKGRRVWLEILAWAFFGILTRLIVSCGWYVYKDRFYRRAVWQHVTLLVVVPGLTLVLVLILSLFSLKFPVEGGESVAIELSNPLILAVVSFLVACVPWRLWNRLRETGELLAATVQQ